MKPIFRLMNEINAQLETFASEKGSENIDLESFILWLNREALFQDEIKSHRYMKDALHPAMKVVHPDDDDEHEHENEVKHQLWDAPTHAHPSNVHLTLLLYSLSKHYKLYSRKVLLDSDLVSMDGHTFLSALSDTESMRRMDLIRSNFMEASSGNEVIKRLLKKGFIEEFDDPDDKRVKRVRVTEKGRQAYLATLPPIRKVIEIMAGKMSVERKVLLISLLDELNDFHASMHEEAKKLSLDQILNKYQK